MARFMKQGAVIDMAVTYFPAFLRSRQSAIRLDKWMNGRQADLHDGADSNYDIDPTDVEFGRPYAPKDTTDEYENLQSISPNAFAGLVVASLAQTAYIEGIGRPKVKGHLPVWETFRRNRLLSKQTAIHRTAIGMSQAYAVLLPGKDPLTGKDMSKILLRSPKRMAAFYDNDDDEWPVIAVDAVPRYETADYANTPIQTGWTVQIWDSYVVHNLVCKGDGRGADQWTYIDHSAHNTPVPPIARLANRVDLDGRTVGEIEPVLPLLRRIDQDVFDRLIIQRFGAWKVRYIAGMAKPTSTTEAQAEKMRLRIEDILISTNEKTQFGTLDATPLEPQIGATDADLRLLAAITQTPPHHLLGLSSNLQAEALAAAESGLQRKSFDFKTNADEFYISLTRLDAMQRGDMETANAFDIKPRWHDTESKSFAQAAQALGLLATQLKVPLEMLWERVPGWTDDDVTRAKELAESGELEKILGELAKDLAPQENEPKAPSGDGS